ncbi:MULTISPECIES: hypothetical protein [unclassified Natrinema]|uniref:hypothetical protein n=1 Tax=unclassified Natrinema TaxID=2622230 RepID=UPI00026D49EF|nr:MULTISPECIES: hypothetical protein [unclassified Natrinema]AFO59197.1 hypothetical protein NJ7G_3983 [Natrinema sp. J7-2]
MTVKGVDPETAESLARDWLVEALRHSGESTRSDVAQLAEHTAAIKIALERGEALEMSDIEQARFYTEQVKERLDEVTTLFGWNPWDTGAKWGELTEEQKTEIEERDHERFEDDTDGDGEGDDENVLGADLVVLRTNLEEGLSQAEHKGADREAVARMLELYAEYVREGYTCPPSRRGNWWQDVHDGGECDV